MTPSASALTDKASGDQPTGDRGAETVAIKVEIACEAMYGANWHSPDPQKRPGEKMKDVWRGLARKAVEAIDRYDALARGEKK